MVSAFVAAVVFLLVSATADAQQMQCANGVCRLVQAPVKIVRAVVPRREPTASIATRYVGFDIGPVNPTTAPPAAPPEECQCDPCNCAAQSVPVQRIESYSVHARHIARYRSLRPFGQIGRGRLLWFGKSCCR